MRLTRKKSTLTRSCGNMSAAAALTASLSSDDVNVAEPDSQMLTIPAGTASAGLQVRPVTRPGVTKIKASTGGAPGPTMDVTVRGRATGCFSAVSANFAQTGTRNSGSFSVDVSIQSNSSPPPLNRYTAQFKAGNQSRGSSVAFFVDTLGGGAGFCSASNVGAVLSGYAGDLGHSSDYVFSLMDLLATNAPIREFPVWAKRSTPPAQYAPVLQLSPDCTLAVVAGLHPVGGPEKHQLRIVDVLSGSPLPSGEIGFNGQAVRACVVNKPGYQQVEVSIDGVASGSVRIP